MSDSIKVAIKVRPLIKREKDDNLPIQWTVQGNSIISTDPEMKKRGDGGFIFDHIFDTNASNSDVFDTVVKPIVNAAVSGFNGTVFAYGQTSSGKTYTMLGDTEEPGIVPLAIEHMFDAISNTVGREFLLRVSYLEIYNEKVNDLLDKSGTDLKLKEDGTGQVILQCKEEITNCPHNVLTIMKKGDKNRRIGETNMNERSSRSHTIFRITIESREAGSNSDGAIQVSQLNLVDLAGSERARQTGATGERFKEGRHINLSLSTLGLVIMQLSESQDLQKHVNFRDSKLTRLLQNSLGGNAMTAIICAVTPAALEETQCTLSFASRAKSVKNKPQVNEVVSDAALLKRYAKQLTKLQEELEKMKNENKSAQVEEMECKLLEKERINQLLEERIELLKTRIVSGDVETEDESLKNKNKYKRRQTWGGPGIGFKQHPSVCKSMTPLPTVKEVSFETTPKKNIFESMDIMNQTFQTAFADFELELYESERNRESRDHASDSEEEWFVTKRNQRVTFRDDVFTIKTPERCNVSIQTYSPGTPQHILRQHNMNLRKEYEELCEFTTLEKQLTCQEKHCRIHGEDGRSLETGVSTVEERKSVLENFKAKLAPEISERLENLNLPQETDINHVITELCTRLNEIEKQSALEKESNNKMTKQFSELQRQMENMTSERNEFEYISRELRRELNKKTAELELKIMSEEAMREEETKRISDMKQQLDSVENVISEKNELQRVNSELQTKFDKKALEFETMILSHQMENEKDKKQISELKKQIATVISDKIELAHVNNELRNKLSKRTSELKEKIKTEKAGNEEVMEMIAELEVEFEHITSTKTDFECAVNELRRELDQRISELESEQIVKQKALGKISELNKQIDCVTSERNEFERLNRGLNDELKRKISEFETQFKSETLAHLRTTSNDDNEEETSAVPGKRDANTDENDSLENYVKDLENSVANLRSENQDLREQLRNDSILMNDESNANISNFMLVEAEKSQLEVNLRLKSQELEEIKSIVQDVAKLQEIIDLLTNENMEMATKLNTEQETALQTQINLQKTIDELYTRISEITNEKIILESELQASNEQLESMRSKVSASQDQEQLFASYQTKIDKLTAENIELSMSISEKNKELNDIKESKSLLFDHECVHKERVTALEEQNKYLVNENGELSTDLMDKIEEIDMLKEQYDILKSKVEESSSMKSAESDVEQLKTENNTLKGEIAELKTKVTILSEENAKFSTSLFETVENLDASYNEKVLKDSLHLSAIFDVDVSDIPKEEETRETLVLKVATLQSKVDHLKRLNKKLSDLKLASCNQCAHLKNLNENRRALKLEVNALNKRLEDLQKKYDRKCAGTEVEINQKLDASNMSLNLSSVDETHVSVVEEKTQSLNSELQILKDDHDQLSRFKIKAEAEIEELRELNKMLQQNLEDATNCVAEPLEAKIQSLNSELQTLKDDHDQLSRFKIKAEAETEELRELNKMLQQNLEDATNRVAESLKAKIQSLNSELQILKDDHDQLSRFKIKAEAEIEELRELNKMLQQNLEDATNRVAESLKATIQSLNSELQTLKDDHDQLSRIKIKAEAETEELRELNKVLQQNLEGATNREAESLEAKDRTLKDLVDLKTKYELALKENEELKTTLLSYKSRYSISSSSVDENKYKDLLLEKNRIALELEGIKTVLSQRENEITQYVNQIQQNLEGATNRVAESLETKIQSLNSELQILKDDYDQLSRFKIKAEAETEELRELNKMLEQNLEGETNRVAESLEAKDRTLKDLVDLKTKYELALQENEELKMTLSSYKSKYSIMSSSFDKDKYDALLSEKNRIALELEGIKTVLSQRENEITQYVNQIQQNLEGATTRVAESLEAKIQSLNSELQILKDDHDQLSRFKVKAEAEIEKLRELNKMLQQNLEGATNREAESLEAKDRTLKDLVDLKTKYELALQENEELKMTLSSYKSKYSILSSSFDKDKYDALLSEKNRIALELEGIKTVLSQKENEITQYVNQIQQNLEGATTRVAESLEAKIQSLNSELQILKDDHDQLSRFKVKAEAEIEKLRELNKMLQQNLEGATNREAESLEAKDRTLKDLVDLKTKYELALQENEELKMTLSSYKSRYSISSSSMDKDKYDDLLLEKNRIALELEGIKAVLSQRENEITQYVDQIQQLTENNKELDDELEEYGGIIRERDAEISKLEDKLLSRLTENEHISELEAEMKKLRVENQELRDQVDALKMRLEMDTGNDDSQNTITQGTYNRVEDLEKERDRAVKELEAYKLLLNQRELKDAVKRLRDLTAKSKDLDDGENSRMDLHLTKDELDDDTRMKLEYLVAENEKLKHKIKLLLANSRTFNESSTSNDGAGLSEKTSTSHKDLEVQCEKLKKKIHELELQLVSKNGQVATLQLQIESENFPYRNKCKELNEMVLAYRTKNANLVCEVKSLQRALNDVSTWECDICRKWRVNRTDQACQTIPNSTIRFCGVNSGVVEEHVKIQKLEKEKTMLKDVCRSRARIIKELEERLKEFEETRSQFDSRSNKVLQEKSNE